MLMISKDGEISEFPEYHSSGEEEPTEQPRVLNKYGFVDHPELQRNKFAPHRLPQREGNMNGWLIEDEDEPLEHEASDKEVDSDLDSTASSKPNGPYNNNNNEENPDIAAIIAQQLQTVLPQIVIQVTNNVNNSNGVNGGNNGCTYKGFMACNPKEYDGKGGTIALTWWIEKMENVIDNSGCVENQKVKYAASSFVNKALTWWNTQVQARGREAAIDGGSQSWGILIGFMNCQKPGYIVRNCHSPIKQVVPINAVRGGYEPGTCYECGSREHYQNTYPKLNLAPGQVGNRLTIEGNRNSRNNGNQVKGRAFNVNAVGALQDPNVVTGTFSLNHHYATVLFDSGADFSFISTDFAPLLNMKPSFVNPRYVIEVADGKKVEVDRVIRDCKLELGTSLFTIDLIPLGHGSFDVIVGMDWLSEHKAEIVCHEKVVRIPLENGEILHVQGERTSGIAKALSNVKVDEPKLSDIFVVRDFVEVFPKDLSGLPPQRQVEFRIDLVPGATSVAKSPYRLAPSEMQELSEQLQELKDKVYSKSKDGHEGHLRLVLELLKKEEMYAKFSNKIKAVKNWKAPLTPSEIRSFLGLAGIRLCTHAKRKDLEALLVWRWIELFSDYECEICYHPGKANVVADALSRKERVKSRHVRAMAMTIQSRIRGMVLAAQGEAFKQENVLIERLHALNQQMEMREDGSLYFLDRTWVPLVRADKMYLDLRDMYWWPGMKRNISTYVSKCLTCAKVKLPRSRGGYDAIWVIVDRLTKSAHFLAIREDFSTKKLVRLYIDEIVAQHKVPVSIILDQDGRFTSHFWQSVQKALGTRLDLNFGGSWDVHLPLAEFSYNNSYHSSIQCAPFEALYGRKYRLPVLRAEIGEGSLIGPELVQETTDKVVLIKVKLKVARDHQKSYVDNKRKPLEFEVGDKVLLKVSPWKGVMRFRKRGKLAPRYVGSFEILERIGPVAYRLRFPKELGEVHDIFHVSNLKKCLADLVSAIVRQSGPNNNNNNNNEENPDIVAIIAYCTYKRFMACNPKEYDGKGGMIALTRWIEKMENVINNSGCAENQKVKYAASSFMNKDLTWWNTQVQARGREAAIGMSWTNFKPLLVEEFCPSNEMEKLESEFWNHKMVGANHAGYTDWFHELAKLVLHLVTPESSCIKRYIVGLAPEIRGMLRVTQLTTIRSEILRARILTDEVVSYGTLTKGSEKRKGVEESSKHESRRNDDKRAKVSKGFVVATTHRNQYDGSLPSCAKCLAHHPKDGHCLVCFNCQKPSHIARNSHSPIKQVAPINAVRGRYEPGTCYECGSREHYQNTCPKLNLEPSQVGNRLTIEGNRNSRNNKNQVKGRAFNVNVVGALQDPNVVT
ncbi:putative reverse transcriptase domain-containing protein, partial [Tanacetum coccineum]